MNNCLFFRDQDGFERFERFGIFLEVPLEMRRLLQSSLKEVVDSDSTKDSAQATAMAAMAKFGDALAEDLAAFKSCLCYTATVLQYVSKGFKRHI